MEDYRFRVNTIYRVKAKCFYGCSCSVSDDILVGVVAHYT